LVIAQKAYAQVTLGPPNLEFNLACASPSFNIFNVTFSATPQSALGASNEFIIELSDGTGSFADSIEINANIETVTTSSIVLSFSIPETTSGDAYKLRIKSTDPVAISSNSDAFEAYYRIHNEDFTINNFVDTAEYCSGGSYLLTIDPSSESNNSPLDFPSLTYNWFRVVNEETSTFTLVSTGPTFSVDTPGTYFAETNYGTCTNDSRSNRVTVIEIGGGGGLTADIDSSLGNPYCIDDGPTTLSTISGNSYQWFKDGIEIVDAVDQTYITNESGTYTVSIDLGTCIANATITLENGESENEINVMETNPIGEGETLDVIVTTSAVNAQFEWYLNNAVIIGETEDTYTVTEPGNYSVIVSQMGGCSQEFVFSVIDIFPSVEEIPNLVSPNADGTNDTWIVPQSYIRGTNTNITIISSNGEIVFETDNYLNNWPVEDIEFKNINPVYYYIIEAENGDIKKGSITVIK